MKLCFLLKLDLRGLNTSLSNRTETLHLTQEQGRAAHKDSPSYEIEFDPCLVRGTVSGDLHGGVQECPHSPVCLHKLLGR